MKTLLESINEIQNINNNINESAAWIRPLMALLKSPKFKKWLAKHLSWKELKKVLPIALDIYNVVQESIKEKKDKKEILAAVEATLKDLKKNYDGKYVDMAMDLYNQFFKENTGESLTECLNNIDYYYIYITENSL